eukprot:3776463-Pyramimonas_sp.AAC.1
MNFRSSTSFSHLGSNNSQVRGSWSSSRGSRKNDSNTEAACLRATASSWTAKPAYDIGSCL